MKTISLGELGEFKNGLNFTNCEVKMPCKILGVADFKGNIFPPYDELKFVEKSIVPDDFLLKENDIVFVRSNGNKNLVGRALFIKDIKEEVSFSGFCIRFRPTTKILSPEYIYYMLKSAYCKEQYSYSQQTNITNLSQDVLAGVKIPLIDGLNENIKLMINIDKAIEKNSKILNNLDLLANTILDNSIVKKIENNSFDCSIGELVNFDIGKEYANFASDKGKYRYFTCSQDVLWCDEFAFNTKAIIVATHGDFHVEHYEGKFNAYFCNSVLIPKNDLHFGLVYYSLNKYLPKLKLQSSGSVIKFISNEDLANLLVAVPENNDVLQKLNLILKKKQNLINQNIQYNKIKIDLSKFLLNGQAFI